MTGDVLEDHQCLPHIQCNSWGLWLSPHHPCSWGGMALLAPNGGVDLSAPRQGREPLGARPTSVTPVSMVTSVWPRTEQAASKASPLAQLLSSKHHTSATPPCMLHDALPQLPTWPFPVWTAAACGSPSTPRPILGFFKQGMFTTAVLSGKETINLLQASQFVAFNIHTWCDRPGALRDS